MRIFFAFFLFIVDCFILYSCNSDNKNASTSKQEIVLDTNASVSYVPVIKDTNKRTTFLRLLNIPNDTQPKEMEIRFWFDYALSKKGKALILTNLEGHWHSRLIVYELIADNANNLLEVKKEIIEKKTKSRVQEVIKKLESLGISELKTYKDIPQYITCSDGNYLEIEVEKKDSVNSFSYPCWDLYEIEYRISGMESIIQMIKVLESEFDIGLFLRNN